MTSPSRSPITNCWGSARTMRVPTEEIVVFRGVEGAAYNHHPQITSLDDILFATWSSAEVHEDSPGQRMMLATSDDEGRTWSDPHVLVDRQPGEHGWGVVTSMGIYEHDSRLMAYWGYYDYTETALRLFMDQQSGINGKMDPALCWHQGTYTGIVVSDDRGRTWKGPVARIERFCPNLCPQRLGGGRLIMPGNLWYPYTDDPYGIDGWHTAGVPRLPVDYVDDPEGFWKGKHHRGDSHACCEGSCYETDDRVIHMMLRTETHRLAVTESRDAGATWSEPMLTDYTDCNCRFHFGRFSDGRFFGLGCPEPRSKRTPMVLATSGDGVRFERHYVLGDAPASPPRRPGIFKHGRYGYPTYHLADGTLFIMYSVNKEDIAMMRVPLRLLSG